MEAIAYRQLAERCNTELHVSEVYYLFSRIHLEGASNLYRSVTPVGKQPTEFFAMFIRLLKIHADLRLGLKMTNVWRAC
jgi:hypothetical protein